MTNEPRRSIAAWIFQLRMLPVPVAVKIFPERGLVFVRYRSRASVHDGMQAFAEYIRHPDFRPGQKQLIDLSAISTFTMTPSDLLKFNALRVSGIAGDGETLMSFYAPTPQGQKVARISVRAWEPFNVVVARVFDHEEGALSFLGLRETRLADLQLHPA